MADISQEQFERFMEEIRSNSGAMGKLSKALSYAHKHQEKIRADTKRKMEQEKLQKSTEKLAQKIDRASEGFKLLEGDADNLRNSFRTFARGVIGGALLAQMIDGASDLVKTYREVAEVGQSFNGSVFEMAKAAAQAGMPLQEYAAAVKKSSKAMAVYGAKPVMEMAKQVRQGTEKFGMYGYTLEGLNNVTLEYLETQRLYGNKSAVNNSVTTKSVQNLAKHITALADTTGEAREKILEMTQQAMRDVSLSSRFTRTQHTQMQAFVDKTQDAIATLSAMPGEAGAVLSKFAAQTIGWGNSLFAEGANVFIEAGLGGMVGAMDQLSRSVMMGGDTVAASWEVVDEFKNQVEQNIDSLRIQAMSGNQNAVQVLRMYSEIKDLTKTQYDQKQKDLAVTKNLSAFMLSFSNIAKRLLNTFLIPIFEGFSKLDFSMTALTGSGAMEKLEEMVGSLGKRIGEFIGNISPKEMKNFADGIKAVFDGLIMLGVGIGKIADVLISFTNGVQKHAGTLTALTVGIGGIFLGKAILGAITSFLGIFIKQLRGSKVNSMIVNSRHVVVEGGSYGSGFGGGGGAGGKGPKGKGRLGRLGGRIAGVAGVAGGFLGGALMEMAFDEIADMATKGGGKVAAKEVGEAGAKASGKGLGIFGKLFSKEGAKLGAKATGKALVKKIPLIGLGAGALFGLQRLMAGDKTGAAMEVGSGAASLIPGVGTAASLAMDGAIAARDLAGPKTDDAKITQSTVEAQRATTESLQNDQKTAATDTEQAELKKMQLETQKMLEAQIALLREQNDLLKKNNQLTRTMTYGVT